MDISKKTNIKRSIFVSILMISLILTGCTSNNQSEKDNAENEIKIERQSKDTKKDLKKKESLDSIIGEVLEVSEDSIILKSLDRKVAGSILTSNKVKSDDKFVFYEGDIVKLYYESSAASPEGERIVELTYVDVIDEVQGDDYETKVDYYSFPRLSVSTGDSSYELSEKASAMTHDIMGQFEWAEGKPENYKSNYTIMNGVEVEVYYDSKTKTLYDDNYNIHLTLEDPLSSAIERALKNEIK